MVKVDFSTFLSLRNKSNVEICFKIHGFGNLIRKNQNKYLIYYKLVFISNRYTTFNVKLIKFYL